MSILAVLATWSGAAHAQVTQVCDYTVDTSALTTADQITSLTVDGNPLGNLNIPYTDVSALVTDLQAVPHEYTVTAQTATPVVVGVVIPGTTNTFSSITVQHVDTTTSTLNFSATNCSGFPLACDYALPWRPG